MPSTPFRNGTYGMGNSGGGHGYDMSAIGPALPIVNGASTLDYAPEGPKWGASQAAGTPGGVVTFSFASSFFQNEMLQYDPTGLDAEKESIFRQAFAAWSGAGNIKFQEVPDAQGVNIRIGLTPLGTGELGFTYYAFNGAELQQAWIELNDQETYQDTGGTLELPDGTSFLSVAEHEIGHAIPGSPTTKRRAGDHEHRDRRRRPADARQRRRHRAVWRGRFGGDRRRADRAVARNSPPFSVPADANGNVSMVLPPNTPFTFEYLDISDMSVATFAGVSNGSGETTTIPDLPFTPIGSLPADADGLPDIAASIIGANPDVPDSLIPGMSDLAALQAGLVGNAQIASVTGVVASLPLAGAAQAVALAGSTTSAAQTAYVATGASGLAIVDVSDARAPAVQAQLALSGTARRRRRRAGALGLAAVDDRFRRARDRECRHCRCAGAGDHGADRCDRGECVRGRGVCQ